MSWCPEFSCPEFRRCPGIYKMSCLLISCLQVSLSHVEQEEDITVDEIFDVRTRISFCSLVLGESRKPWLPIYK